MNDFTKIAALSRNFDDITTSLVVSLQVVIEINIERISSLDFYGDDCSLGYIDELYNQNHWCSARWTGHIVF